MALLFHTRPKVRIDVSNRKSIEKAEETLNAREFSKLISSRHYSESVYETIVISGLRLIVGNNCYVIPYKHDIVNKKTERANAPDVMVFHKSLKTWFIVELELLKPSVSHAIEQLDTFTNYELRSILNHVDYIKKKINEIDPYFNRYEELENLISTKKAEVVLMAEHIPVDWRQKLKDSMINCFSCTFQIYSDDNKIEFLRINDEGAFSNIYHKKLVKVDLLNSCLLFRNGVSYFTEYENGSEIEIILESVIYNWKLEKKQKHVRLFYDGIGFPVANMVKDVMLIIRESRLELKYVY
ncbi:MAG: hypothetical protein RIC95_10670 [Vicingaceae bacterium]